MAILNSYVTNYRRAAVPSNYSMFPRTKSGLMSMETSIPLESLIFLEASDRGSSTFDAVASSLPLRNAGFRWAQRWGGLEMHPGNSTLDLIRNP